MDNRTPGSGPGWCSGSQAWVLATHVGSQSWEGAVGPGRWYRGQRAHDCQQSAFTLIYVGSGFHIVFVKYFNGLEPWLVWFSG